MVLASINQGENERKEETKEWMRLPASLNDHKHLKNTVQGKSTRYHTCRSVLTSEMVFSSLRCSARHLHRVLLKPKVNSIPPCRRDCVDRSSAPPLPAAHSHSSV